MQDTSGIKRFLSIASVYELFQILVGSHYSRNWISRNFWRLQGGEKVVDIGCGPGDMLRYLRPT